MHARTLPTLALIALTLTGCSGQATAADAPSYSPVALDCPAGTVPGWLDEHGNPTSCVNDTPIVPLDAPTFAAAGDSITAWTDAAGADLRGNSWTTSAFDDALHFHPEGYARGGAKLSEIDAATVPVTVDTFVIMAGTNDLGDRWGTPVASMRASVESIAAKSGAPRIVLSAIAPFAMNTQWSNFWNMQLRDLAAIHGWDYVNPWGAPVGTAAGAWAPNASVEGVHPTPATAVIVGQRMREAILAG